MKNLIILVIQTLQIEAFDVNKSFKLLTQKLESWYDSAILILPNLILAAIVFVSFIVLSNILKRVTRNLTGRVTDNETILKLASNLVYLTVFGVGFFISLDILQLDKAVASLLAGAGVIGLALSFAFQNLATNFISGVIIVLRKPVAVGDIIQSNDYFGTVQRVNIRATHILTPDGQYVFIPNKEVIEKPIINFTRLGVRRVDLQVGISYGEKLPKVKDIVYQAIEKIDYIRKEREIEIFYEAFGDSSINFVVRFWIEFKRQADYKKAVSDAIINIKEAFDENNITIPFPIRTLDFGIKGGEKFAEVIDKHPIQLKKEE